ncbi:NUDIX domain-containing protein [candidate division KSB1 bacterium]
MFDYEQKIREHLKFNSLGTGSLIGDRHSGLWWCLGPKKFWRHEHDRVIITYTAVGGKVEVGETLLQALERETKEEIGVFGTINSSPRTLFYTFDKKYSKWVDTLVKPAPAIIYDNFLNGFSVAAYWIKIPNTPKAHSEISGMIRIPFDFEYSDPYPLSHYLKNGAEIVSCESIPERSVLKPFGTAYIWTSLPHKTKDLLCPREL